MKPSPLTMILLQFLDCDRAVMTDPTGEVYWLSARFIPIHELSESIVFL